MKKEHNQKFSTVKGHIPIPVPKKKKKKLLSLCCWTHWQEAQEDCSRRLLKKELKKNKDF
jgi:hypothetical protein